MATSFPDEPHRPDSPDDPEPIRPLRAPIPIDSARTSRLDREVDEILTKAIRDTPLPPTPIASRRRTPASGPPVGDRLRRGAAASLDVLMTVPLLTAVGLGIACAVVAPYSRLLATLFAILAVVVLVAPYIQAARRSSLPGGDGPKTWRGRVMDAPPPARGMGERTPADKISEWINSRRS